MRQLQSIFLRLALSLVQHLRRLLQSMVQPHAVYNFLARLHLVLLLLPVATALHRPIIEASRGGLLIDGQPYSPNGFANHAHLQAKHGPRWPLGKRIMGRHDRVP